MAGLIVNVIMLAICLSWRVDGSDDYVLVNFIKEGCTAVVPLSRVRNTVDNEECFVLWHNRKEYKAYHLLSGMYIYTYAYIYICLNFVSVLAIEETKSPTICASRTLEDAVKTFNCIHS